MEKLYFENKYCKISLNKEGEYEVVLKRNRGNIRRYQIFKRKWIQEHYYYSMKYDPDLKWYFVVPILLSLFLLPMIFADLLRESQELMMYWNVVEMILALITFSSLSLLLTYLFVDKLFDVRFVSVLLSTLIRRKVHGYVIKLIQDKDRGIEIPLSNEKEQFKLIESLNLK